MRALTTCESRSRERIGLRLLALALVSVVASFGCTPDFATQNDADVILRIQKIVADPGAQGGEVGDFLLSDVTPVFNDNAIITFELLPKNPGAVQGLFNDVFLERYEVRFFRTDGHDTEGVDVPFRFTGAMATMVPDNGTAEAAIIVVRHSAKEEPPLRNLAFAPQAGVDNGPGGGEGIIHAIAEMTFHGRTTSGHAVTTTGRLSVTFADFADATPTPSPSPSTIATPLPPSPVPSASPKK
jgi:hypothetical protein